MQVRINREIVLVIFTVSLTALALFLSYKSVINFESGLKAKMECQGGKTRIILENHVSSCKLYYIVISRGDKIIKILEFNENFDLGMKEIELDLKGEGIRISIIFDKGIIGGLTCGSISLSQP
jgi:hypothetical protein